MMIETSALVVFMTAALVLLLTPGPAVLFIVARSLEQGRTAGVVSALGIGLAALVHVVVAALGLSALLMQSALAFSVVKYLGAAYLIYLGVRTLLGEAKMHTAELAVPRLSWRRILGQGFMVNLLNPKTALFFFAFLPQFVNPSQGSLTAQVIFLGLVFVVMAITSDSMYALVAGTVRQVLVGNEQLARWQKRFAGTVYIGLGLATAFSGSGGQK